ncbi:MAG TPA: hypothetical protein VES36_07370 [Candidatus Limnocylindrales bacterium]|nr:hypothetical protein [Candidatus Limnocylindrales bacterium]
MTDRTGNSRTESSWPTPDRERARGRPIRAAAATLDKAHERLAHAHKFAKALLGESGGGTRKAQLAAKPAQKECGSTMALPHVPHRSPGHRLDDAHRRLSVTYRRLIAVWVYDEPVLPMTQSARIGPLK